MISKKVVEMINKQITREIDSAYIYQAMEMYIGNEYNFPGIQNFFHIQAQEENAHAYLMIDYLHRLGEKVELGQLDKPKAKYASILDAFESALEHERQVTAWINEIMVVAVKEKDFASQVFLNFFINEQVEEEESFTKHVDTLKFIAADPHATLLFDRELAGRVFVPPVIG